MNNHATKDNKRVIKIVRNILLKYDGIFDSSCRKTTDTIAEHIVKNLKRNKIIKT